MLTAYGVAVLAPLVYLVSFAQAEVVYYPPKSSNINNIKFALNGSGAPGIFSSSVTPDKEYGVYNWCNMPHVRAREYKAPPSSKFMLKYVEVIQRHQKRTPYASNTFFKEGIPWDCVGEGPVYGGKSSKGSAANVPAVQWQAFTDSENPFVDSVGPGFVHSTCQFPQITAEGIEDAITHGADIRSVYGKSLGFDAEGDTQTVQIRVTNNQITSQIASGLIKGLFPRRTTDLSVLIQSPNFDSLEPAVSCPNANVLKTAFTTGNKNWTDHLAAAAGLYEKLDKISGIEPNDSGGWHVSFDHYYDNMSAKQCHGKPLPCSVNDTSLCVTQDEANEVYRLGNWEYSHMYRDNNNSAQYSALIYGAFMLELKGHLQAVISGSSKIKYRHNIGHDGSISPLLGFLQISEMVWPGMGSQVVTELYEQASNHHGRNVAPAPESTNHGKPIQGGNSWFIRVLWGGQPMETSTPLGTLDMIPVKDFFDYIDSMTGGGSALFKACHA